MSEGDNLWTKKLSEKPKDYEKKIAKAQITNQFQNHCKKILQFLILIMEYLS